MADKNDGASKLEIYLSYVPNDYFIAYTIKNLLEVFGAGRLKIYLTDEIKKGVKFEDILEKSRWFILLLTGPSDHRVYQLYEAGMFAGLEREGDRPLIVLCATSAKRPDITPDHQIVTATPDKMQLFMQKLYSDSFAAGVPPINPNLVKDRQTLDILIGKLIEAIENSVPKLVGISDYSRSLLLNRRRNLDLNKQYTTRSDSNFSSLVDQYTKGPKQ